MSTETILLILTVIFGFYMAWSIGANDVANAMGTSVGSGALTLKRAVILAAVLEFSGAYLVGSHVSDTLKKGILDVAVFSDMPMTLALGMMAALLAAGFWLQAATWFGWPVSTTHSIVGAVVGFGAVVGGVEAVRWAKVGTIVSSWVVSPVLSGTIAFVLFKIILQTVFYQRHPASAIKRVTPILSFVVGTILTLTLLFKGLQNLNLQLSTGQAILAASLIGVALAFIAWLFVRRINTKSFEGERKYQDPKVKASLLKTIKHLERVQESASGDLRYQASRLLDEVRSMDEEVKVGVEEDHTREEMRVVEKVFIYLQILSAAFMAFAHGANDVANAVGPLAAVIGILETGTVALETAVPPWVLLLGGVGIVVGLATWGWRVMETIGRQITELSPSRGFCAEFAAAITIVLASKLGFPISTTHTLVGAVLGVGLARGIGALNLNTMRDIAASWIITVPAGAGLCVVFYYILATIFPV